MNKIIKIILIISLIVFGAGFSLTPSAVAQSDNLVVEFQTTPLFNETNFFPGENVTRWVKITNNSSQTQKIAVETINENDPDSLGSQLNLVIKEGDQIRYNDTLANFFSVGEVYLSDLAGNGTQTQYDFTVTFALRTENPFQGKILGFDLLVGFQGTEGGSPPTPPGGGGGVLPPGLTIQDESVRVTEIGETSVTIIWTTSYSSTSQVIYGTGTEAHTLDLSDNTGTPPKYGYAHTTLEYNTSPKVTAHAVTITGLIQGTTYYFRAVSHASLAISREFSFTTSGSTEKTIGEIEEGELIFPQPEGVPIGGGEEGLVEKPPGEQLVSGKETEKLPTEERKAWWEGLINEGLLATIGLMPLNFKLILFLVLIIFVVFLISKLIIKRKRENKFKT